MFSKLSQIIEICGTCVQIGRNCWRNLWKIEENWYKFVLTNVEIGRIVLEHNLVEIGRNSIEIGSNLVEIG